MSSVQQDDTTLASSKQHTSDATMVQQQQVDDHVELPDNANHWSLSKIYYKRIGVVVSIIMVFILAILFYTGLFPIDPVITGLTYLAYTVLFIIGVLAFIKMMLTSDDESDSSHG